MEIRLLHVSDTLYDEKVQEEELRLAGLAAVLEQARTRDVDAILHTGNLFQRPSPGETAIEALADELAVLNDEQIEVYAVPGKRDAVGEVNPIEQFERQGLVTVPGTEPELLNDAVAIYGLPYEDDDQYAATIKSEIVSLDSPKGKFYKILCTHQEIWPPFSQDVATVSAYDIMNGIDGWIDAVAAGATRKPQSWHNEQGNYHVFYPGTTNPGYTPAGTDPQGFVYRVRDRENLSWEQTPITSSEPTDELGRLKTFLLEYESSSLESADIETLADLYALLSEGRSMLEDRRKTVRNIVLDRTESDTSIRGSIGEVHHREYTRRSVRDENEVFTVLEEHDVDPEEVTEETIDSDRLETVVEGTDITTDEVFEEETVASTRKGDLELSQDR